MYYRTWQGNYSEAVRCDASSQDWRPASPLSWSSLPPAPIDLPNNLSRPEDRRAMLPLANAAGHRRRRPGLSLPSPLRASAPSHSAVRRQALQLLRFSRRQHSSVVPRASDPLRRRPRHSSGRPRGALWPTRRPQGQPALPPFTKSRRPSPSSLAISVPGAMANDFSSSPSPLRP
jgi:hypothetical protein